MRTIISAVLARDDTERRDDLLARAGSHAGSVDGGKVGGAKVGDHLLGS